MIVTTTELAELFYGSNIHQTFNATVAIAGHQRLDLLVIAAQLDAEEFLVRYPDLWSASDPYELAITLASDFVDRWPMLCRNDTVSPEANRHDSSRFLKGLWWRRLVKHERLTA